MNPIENASSGRRVLLLGLGVVIAVVAAVVALALAGRDDGSSTADLISDQIDEATTGDVDEQDSNGPDVDDGSGADLDGAPSDNPSGDDLSGATTSTTSPDPTDGTTGTVDETLVGHDDPEIEALMRVTERIRGLRFLEPVDTELLAEDAFRAQLLEEFTTDLDSEGLDEVEDVWQALALIEPGTDVEEVLLSALGEGVLGYYDPTANRLVMRGSELTPFVASTLVHELTHALDDQHFELDRPELEDDEAGEASWGFTGIVEGSASWVEDRWKEELSAADALELERESARFAAGMDFSAVPEIVLIDLSLPYEFGPILVDQLIATGGTAALDAALVEPPVSGEQVFDPAAYFEGDVPVEVPLPPADGEVVHTGVLGVSSWFALTFRVEFNGALDFIQYWGGDSYVTWRDGDRQCLRVDVVVDENGDIGSLAAAMSSVAAAHPDAEMTRPDDDTARLTACA